MYFFNNHESEDSRLGLLIRSLSGGPSGETPPKRLFVELLALVLLLHAWLLDVLKSSDEALIEAKPLIMQVTLIAEQPPKTQPIAEPQPAAPPKPQKKPKPKAPRQSKPKPVKLEKARPAPKTVDVSSPKPPAPKPVSANVSPPSSNPAQRAPAKPEPFTEANYKANYGFNPKPAYPRIARNRGWQGKVLLKVQVSASGTSQNVAVHKSSGHDLLDEAAIEAVKKWRFIPARRGNTPVASSVIVPILFSLQNH